MRLALLGILAVGCSSSPAPSTPRTAPPADAMVVPDADRLEAVLAANGDLLRAVPGVLAVARDGQALSVVACTQAIVDGLELAALGVPTAVAIEPAGIPGHECGCTWKDQYYEPGWVQFPCNAHHCTAGAWGATTLVSCEIMILERVEFTKRSRAIPTSANAGLDLIARSITEHALVVAVHGHRAKGEPAELSLARAAAVSDHLLGLGVAAAQLRTVDDGTALADPAASKLTRVVTFEVVEAPAVDEP